MCSSIKPEPIRSSDLQEVVNKINLLKSTEEKTGEYARNLIHSEQKVESISNQLTRSIVENNASKEQIEKLIEQISQEILDKKNLEVKCKESSQQLHIFRGEIKKLEIEKERLEKQVNSYQLRIQELETELAQQKENSRDREDLKNLENEREKKLTDLKNVDRTRHYVWITGAAAGLLAGGIPVASLTFLASLVVCFMPGTSIPEEMQTRQDISEIERKIAEKNKELIKK